MRTRPPDPRFTTRPIPAGTLTGGLVAHGLGLRAPYLVAGAVRRSALVAALPTLIHALRKND